MAEYRYVNPNAPKDLSPEQKKIMEMVYEADTRAILEARERGETITDMPLFRAYMTDIALAMIVERM